MESDSKKEQPPEIKSDINTVEIDQSFLDKMVKKCEVTNYREMYLKLIHQRGDVVRCDDLFDKDAKYSLEKIRNDIAPISEILLLKLFDPRANVTLIGQPPNKQQQFTKIYYLVNEAGLQRILKTYRQEQFIPYSLKFSQLISLFDLENHEIEKFQRMFHSLIAKQGIYAKFDLNENISESKITFLSVLEIPRKRKQLIELGILTALFISVLIFLLDFVGFI